MSINTISQQQNKELLSLTSWLGKPHKNPKQLNQLNESDCEIVQISEELFLCSTVDSIAEEIALSLYNNPETIGWVAAQASLSDLAACGCTPLGLLFSTIWQFDTKISYKKSVSKSFQNAIRMQNTHLLGGDNASAKSTIITSVGLGLSQSKPKMRSGIKHNDYLCITGKSGRGPALCLNYLMERNSEIFPEELFRPNARIAEGIKLQKIANSVMDTSDGILTTAKQLSEINNLGLKIFWNEKILDPIATEYCNKFNIPKTLLWVAEHGDFELMAAISPELIDIALIEIPDLQVIGQFDKNLNGYEFYHTLSNSIKKIFFDLNKTQFLSSDKELSISKIKTNLNQLISYLKDNNFP